MAASIQNLMNRDGEKITYTLAYRQMIEDHLAYLRNQNSNEIITIRPDVGWRYHGDLHGVLNHYEFDWDMHWIIMRVNNYQSAHEFDYQDQELIIPSSTVISDLTKQHRARRKLENKEQYR